MADKKKKLLIVDDEQIILDMTRSILERRDFEIITALNGIEALEILETQRPDLIITDVLMPEMDGFAFYKELKRNSNTEFIPVLVVTQRGLMEDSFRAMGAADFISKPFAPEDLLEKIDLVFQLSDVRSKNREEEVKKKRSVAVELATEKFEVRDKRRRIQPGYTTAQRKRPSKKFDAKFILAALMVVVTMAAAVYFLPRVLITSYSEATPKPKTKRATPRQMLKEIRDPSSFYIGDTKRTLTSESLRDGSVEESGKVTVMDGIYKEHDENGVLQYEYLYKNGDLIWKKVYNERGVLKRIDRH